MAYLSMSSPIGPLTLFEEDGAIIALEWGKANNPKKQENNEILLEARKQLNDYFDTTRKNFDLPLAPKGSKFQQTVWCWLTRIPYGQVRTYKDGATNINSAPRAIGSACGRNPIPIIIPCHRVIRTDGELGGFSAFNGLETKKNLLYLEEKLVN